MNSLISRRAFGRLTELSRYLRVVLVNGPRQSGKTTLLKQHLEAAGGTYRTFDRADTLRAAKEDPSSFVAYGEPPRIIDEIQRGGDDVVRAVKIAVDQHQRPGEFILSGSSRFLTVPNLSESLAGRMAIVDLWPLSMAERTKSSTDFLANVFGDEISVEDSTWTRDQYVECITAGGYPEALGIGSPVARRAWYDGYLNTIITRDIQDFATITRSDAISTLLSLVAVRAGGQAVLSDLAQAVNLARDTTRSYLSYLNTVYLTMSVPAWSTNLTSRLTKTPKLYPTDSGLAAHLLRSSPEDLADPGNPNLGPLAETFVAAELGKAVAYSDISAQMFHLRTADKNEVDFIIEGPGGKVLAIEVKSSAAPGPSALKGLRWLADQLGDRLHAGILLHFGNEGSRRGERLYSLPLSVLWNHHHLVP